MPLLVEKLSIISSSRSAVFWDAPVKIFTVVPSGQFSAIHLASSQRSRTQPWEAFWPSSARAVWSMLSMSASV